MEFVIINSIYILVSFDVDLGAMLLVVVLLLHIKIQYQINHRPRCHNFMLKAVKNKY